MSRRPLRIALVLLVAALAGVGCCSLALRLLPERYAVNAPLEQLVLGRGRDAADEPTLQQRLRVPGGFQVGLYASGIPNARMLRFTEQGDLLVTSPRTGRVLILAPDRNADGRSDAKRILLEGLDRPHGLEFHDGWLYVAEGNRVVRARYDAAERSIAGELEVVVPELPDGGNHWTRTVRVGPDGALYVSVGSSCNVCVEEDDRRAALLRYELDGTRQELFATGLRNSVGFDWQPETNALYATDNGRDLLGDDIPPCELNRIERGGFYGWPFAYGDRVPDPDLGAGREREIEGSRPPAHPFGAHNAPLGITFLRHAKPSSALQGAALVALHGSWNRTRKDGYKVVSLHWQPDGRIEERDFLTGFLENESVIGRPVDVAEAPDGEIFVSDDYAGAIYRITRAGENAVARSGTAGSASARAIVVASDPLAGLGDEARHAARARGRAHYEANACFRCHETARAEPGAVAVPLEALADRYDLGSLAAFLAAPQPPMPRFELESDQRRDLAAFLLLEHGR